MFEKSKSGPVISHATIARTARLKAQELPVQCVAHRETLPFPPSGTHAAGFVLATQRSILREDIRCAVEKLHLILGSSLVADVSQSPMNEYFGTNYPPLVPVLKSVMQDIHRIELGARVDGQSQTSSLAKDTRTDPGPCH